MNNHLEKQSKYIPPNFFNIPDASLKPIVYKGPSMNPTLKAPDILHVIPYNGGKIKCGDVIVFEHPEGDGKNRITHRVISVDSNGIRTHGDNNCNIDYFFFDNKYFFIRMVEDKK